MIPVSGNDCQSARDRYHSSRDTLSFSNSAVFTNRFSVHEDRKQRMSSRSSACRHCWSKNARERCWAEGSFVDELAAEKPEPMGKTAPDTDASPGLPR